MKNNYIEKYQAMTELVADYSLRLNKDDRLIIQYDPLYTDIVEIVAKTCLNKCPNIILDPLTNNAQYMRDLICANGYKQWDNELARRVFLAKWCTSRLLLDCTRTVNFDFPHASKLKNEFDKIVVGPYKKILYRPGPNSGYEVKWNIAGFPCSHSFYKYLLANKKTYRYSVFKSNAAIYNDYRDLVFDSVLGNDWVAMHTKMEKVKATFDNANNVRIIVGDGTLTDLELSLKGRGGEICSGQNNMPDGEVCYGPVEESLHGHITFQIPSERSPYGVFNTIRLQFHNGKIVDAKELTSKQKNANLNSILDIDMGAKYIGELGIGCNYSIKKHMVDTLFDEKIGGTIHLAIGDQLTSDLSSGGSKNKSAIHWDLVCDLRNKNTKMFPGGKIFVDGKLVQENGEWVI